jgi:uncharacterized protein YndB with AHSA1/START domain
MNSEAITVETTVNAPVKTVWEKWTNPQDIMQWNSASPDWHTPKADNDLRVGGKFNSTMAAKDGSFSFDFWGIYTNIEEYKTIEYTLGDDRKVKITFSEEGGQTKVVETFEPESENTKELQQGGWQAIIDSFKKYVESNA